MPAALSAERASRRPRIAVVDMAVAGDSPAGSCVLAEIQGLAPTCDITVFSDRLDAARPPGVAFVRVRAPARPVLLRYLVFHLSMPVHFALWRARGGQADCVQATQGQLPGAAICYAHFSHRGYLARQWTLNRVRGPRRWARWAVHRFNAACEALAMQRASWIVVPSRGLARELASDYPHVASRIRVIANPVAVERFERPATFDRAAARASHGFDDGQVVLAFMALGDFERKGLGLLLSALAALPEADRHGLGLLVIGGQPGEIADFAALAAGLGVATCVRFAGLQADVRPGLWLADAFAFPSSYETFGLAAAQAAAAGLPVMACEGVHGLEDFVVDDVNGWRIARSHHAVVAWLRRVLDERAALGRMGQAAADAVRPYATPAFQARWRDLFASMLADAARPATEIA
jgi:glycosyltransferase involved in cell wall biosynthesis